MRFGANYTPKVGWFHSWLDLDIAEVERDFEALKALGLDHVRIFPLWPLLQPNRTLIRPRAIADVGAVVDAAHRQGLETWVDVLQGHLSSYDFLPSWVSTWHESNIFTNPDVVSGQRALLAALAAELRGRPGAAGLCLGNEIGQFAAPRHPHAASLDSAEAGAWLHAMMDESELAWPESPTVHCFDDDLWFVPEHPFEPAHAVDFGAMTTVHSWVFMQVGPRYGEKHPALTRFARYLCELATAWNVHRGRAQRPVWLHEIGAPAPVVSEADAPAFLDASLRNVEDLAGLWGVTWWCSHDVSRSLADFPELEYSLGLLDSSGKVKGIGQAFAEYIADYKSRSFSGAEGGAQGAVASLSNTPATAFHVEGARTVERPVLEVPSAAARRAELSPSGEIFDTWLRLWDNHGTPPTLKLS
ncbi:MAG: hypothetical protein Q4G30_00615 [Actinomycetaceae bacterium]|nr:hypothetical protein [Actinomycetaceae bacterium]